MIFVFSFLFVLKKKTLKLFPKSSRRKSGKQPNNRCPHRKNNFLKK